MPKILIIEDDPAIRRVLQVKFTQVNYEVLLGSDGLQGLRVAQEELPHIIISDITMPTMGGLEILENLKADERTRNIPMIFLTQKSSAVDVVKGLQMGAADYLRKPFNMAELLARVEKVLTTHPKTVTDNTTSLYFVSILESLPYGVIVVGQTNKKIEYANAKARSLWNLPVTDNPLEAPPALLKAVLTVVESEGPQETIQIVETKHLGKRKLSFDSKRMVSPVSTPHPTWVITMRDLTDSTSIG